MSSSASAHSSVLSPGGSSTNPARREEGGSRDASPVATAKATVRLRATCPAAVQVRGVGEECGGIAGPAGVEHRDHSGVPRHNRSQKPFVEFIGPALIAARLQCRVRGDTAPSRSGSGGPQRVSRIRSMASALAGST